jgi:hypothetical protein
MRKKRLLLINPWIYDFACYDFWLKPLGLFALAGRFKEGYDISFIDCLDIHHPDMEGFSAGKPLKRREFGTGRFYKENIKKPDVLREIPRQYSRYGIAPELFRKELSRIPLPDAVLVTSMMTYWYPGPFQAIEIVREFFPGVPVLLGGVYAALCYEHAERFSGADHVIRERDPEEIVAFVDSITGQSRNKENGLKGYPLFDMMREIDYVCVKTSTGCPCSCGYCASSLLNGGFVRRKTGEVADEIEHWYQKGVRDFAFYDDALLWKPKEHLAPLLEEILQRKIECRFHAPNGLHLRGITPAIASLMRRAGFRTLRFGLETSDETLQKASGGKITNEEFRASVRYLAEAGFSSGDIGVYILAGLPFQRREAVEETIRFVFQCGARPVITEYSPIPGTRLWEKAVKASQFPIAEEPLFHNNTIVPCQWEGLTYKDLDRLKLLTRSCA